MQLYAKCLLKAGQAQKALHVLQEQYVQTPHYIVLIYLFAKYVVKARLRELYPTSLGALSEVVIHGVHKRRSNAKFYMGVINEYNGLMEQASLHFQAYLEGSSGKQVTDKMHPLRRFTKDAYVAKFQEISLDDLNLTSIAARNTILRSLDTLKGVEQRSIPKSIHQVSPLDSLTLSASADSESPGTEFSLLLECKQIVNSSTQLDKFLMKAKILKALMADKQSGAFAKFFRKLLDYTNALNITKLKASETYFALTKQYVCVNLQLKLIAQSKLAGKTNFEYGVLSEHADRLVALIEK